MVDCKEVFLSGQSAVCADEYGACFEVWAGLEEVDEATSDRGVLGVEFVFEYEYVVLSLALAPEAYVVVGGKLGDRVFTGLSE